MASRLFESLRERADRARRFEEQRSRPAPEGDPVWSLLGHAGALVLRMGPRLCFSVRADNAIATTIVIDPHHRDTDRRWIELEIDVPATACGTHQLTLETRTLGNPDYAWALFRNPVFPVSAVVETDRAAVQRA